MRHKSAPSPGLTVLIPTLNSMPLLPCHVASMRRWLHLAAEIIVVDSYSNDGTPEFLERELHGLPARFFSRERGLYQSWNFGIQQASHPWLYISTVGDSINEDLLQHMLRLGQSQKADIVLSQPESVLDQGVNAEPVCWAIHKILEMVSASADLELTPTAAHCLALVHARTSSLLGSLASDVVRTEHFKKYPFPLDYGMAGDGAWALNHAHHSKIICTAKPGSFFRLHERTYSVDPYKVESLADKLENLGLATHASVEAKLGLGHLRLPELLRVGKNLELEYIALKAQRKSRRPWYIYPSIWRARSLYTQNLKELGKLRERVLSFVRNGNITNVSL